MLALKPRPQQSRRRGSVALARGWFFVESSKVFFSRVDTPEKPLRFEEKLSWFEQNLERFGPLPSLWRTP
jgi:hypothetical protein